MIAPLAPIQAMAANRAPGFFQGSNVDAEIVEKVSALAGELWHVPARDKFMMANRHKKPDTAFPSEMIIANSRRPQRFIPRPRSHPHRPRSLCKSHEGSSTTAYGVYNIESLAAYEQYRARLKADVMGIANFEFARKEQFIRREDRIFLRLASVPLQRL